MRYVLDSEGYVYEVSLGADIICDLGSCAEYTGKIPSGYSTIDEWVIEETPRLNAWKIVEGNLVFDEKRAAELERIFNEQEELNRHVTYGEVQGMLNNLDIEVSNRNELESILPVNTEEGEVIYLDDSSSYPVEHIVITSKGTMEDLNLYISTSNMLPVDVLDGNKNGVIYTVNEDKSISLIGTAEEFTLDISGVATNTEPLFILKAGHTYYINDTSGVTLNLYTHDGTDRTLYYTGVGAASITPEEDIAITHTEISCTGKVDTTVKLMVSVGGVKEYEPCECTILNVDLNGHTAQLGDEIEITDGIIILNDGGINLIDMPCTYYEKTTMYTDKGAMLEVSYKKSDFDTVTKSGKGLVKLRNTADGYGSIFQFVIEDLEGGEIYTLESSDEDGLSESYEINLSDYTGTVDVVIEKGEVTVWQANSYIGSLDSIYIKTYSPTTKIRLVGCTNRMNCEYMVESEFSVYCTRIEKDASIKMLDDKIALEVKRASDVEGSLYGAIEVEADRITQIVSSVGTDGEVTAASIIAAVNEDESSLQLAADKIDITGKTLPTLKNEKGTCMIESQGIISEHGNPMIRHRADVHQFEYYEDTDFSDFRIVTKNFHFLGWGEFRVTGDFYLNGEKVDFNLGADTSHAHDDLYHTKTEIDSKIGDVEAILRLLNGTPEDTTDGHNHNNRYYTEAEIDILIAGIEETLITLNSGGGVA